MLHKIVRWLVIAFWICALLFILLEVLMPYLQSDASERVAIDVDPFTVAIYIVSSFIGIYSGLGYRSRAYYAPAANILCIALLGYPAAMFLSFMPGENDAEFLRALASVTAVFLAPMILHILLLRFWWRNRREVIPEGEAGAAA